MTSSGGPSPRGESTTWTRTNVRPGRRSGLWLASRRCHQRSFQTGRPERRDSSAQLQPRRSRPARSFFMRSGSCRGSMPGRMPHPAAPGESGLHRTVTWNETLFLSGLASKCSSSCGRTCLAPSADGPGFSVRSFGQGVPPHPSEYERYRPQQQYKDEKALFRQRWHRGCRLRHD